MDTRSEQGRVSSLFHKHSRRRDIPVMLLGMVAWPLTDMAASTTDEALFFGELPQVFTVTRLPQSALETPASVTVIDRRMIEASGAVDIPDLFRLVAGFQVGHPYGTRTVVTYHGMTDEFARRMPVLVDGRSVYSPRSAGWIGLAGLLTSVQV